jgi:hypothetical protein
MTKLTANRLRFVLFWFMASYAGLVYAASFAQDMRDFDFASFGLAAVAGLLSGMGRTLISLLSETRPVFSLWPEMLKDAFVALFGGGVVFLCIAAYNGTAAGATVLGMTLPSCTSELRLLLILWAGASRGRWQSALDQFASDAIANARQRLRGGAPVDPSSTNTMSLSDK